MLPLRSSTQLLKNAADKHDAPNRSLLTRLRGLTIFSSDSIRHAKEACDPARGLLNISPQHLQRFRHLEEP